MAKIELNPKTSIVRGDLQIDLESNLVKTPNEVVKLTDREMDLLTLIGNGKPYNRTDVAERSKNLGDQRSMDVDNVSTHLTRLKNKIGPERFGSNNKRGIVAQRKFITFIDIED